MSKRQQIVDAIEARLKTISEGDSVTLRSGRSYTYQTDFGENVFVWHDRPLGKDELLALEVRDLAAPKTTEDVPPSFHRHKLQVEIVLLTQEDKPVEEIRKAIADVSACVGVDPRWSKLARWTTINNDHLGQETTGSVHGVAKVDLEIEYDTHLWEV